MTLNDIKKNLYKSNPDAKFDYIRKGFAYYNAKMQFYAAEDATILKNQQIKFKVPVSDMGDADFTPIMSAKLLIRWILETEE